MWFRCYPYFFSFRSPDTLLINPYVCSRELLRYMRLNCLFLGTWDKVAHVLLSSCLLCSLQACGVGFVFLIAFVWLYLAVGEIHRVRPCYLNGVSFWLPLWIAYVEITQTVPSVFVQYCLLMKILITGRNSMEIMRNREKVTRKMQRALGRIIAATKWTLPIFVFLGKDKTKWGKVKCLTHIRRRWQNIPTNLLGVIGEAMNTTAPFGTSKCIITDEILGNIVQHTNQYILIVHLIFSCESDTKLIKMRYQLPLVVCA